MWKTTTIALALVLAVSGGSARADDVTGADRMLCAAVQATACTDLGECGIDLPWNLNIPEFIEVDLGARRLSTTAASGDDRTTPIEHLTRGHGMIAFHGFEGGRAFSWVIDEASGHATVALAARGESIAVFGACTPAPNSGD